MAQFLPVSVRKLLSPATSPRLLAAIAACLFLAGTQPVARGAFHLWFIQEAYSNASGSVQFIELFTPSSGQDFLNGQTITTTSGAHTFTFNANSPSPDPTTNHHLLLATTGFGSLSGGVTPDFTIPSNFFNPAGDTMTFAPSFGPNGADKKTITTAPTDGINSLMFTGAFSGSTTGANSPENYAGATGSVNLSTPAPTGDYNGNHVVDGADYVSWRNAISGSAVSPAGSGVDGNGDGVVNAADYTFWRSKFGNSAGSGSGLGGSLAAPEPAAIVLLSVAAFLALPRRRR